MKQRLTLILLALVCAFGAKATDVMIANTGSGLPTAAGFGSFSGQVFTTAAGSGLAGVTVTAESGVTIGEQFVNVASYGNCFKMVTAAANTAYRITLAAPDGYIITGYSLGCSANTFRAVHTLTSEDGSVSIVANAPNQQGNAPKPFNVTGLNAQSTYFTISTANMGNTLYLPTFSISVQRADATLVSVTYELYSGDTLVKSVTVQQEAGSAVNVPSGFTDGYSTLAYDAFTTEGTIGDTDTTIRVMTNPKPGLVEELSNLSNARAYTIQCERGFYTVVNDNLANTVKNSGYEVNPFAIVSYEDNYYLWSITAGKFVSCDGAALGNTPVAITMTKVANGLFKFQGGGKTMNATAGFTTGGGFDGWTTTDAGNSCAIIAVAEFDATAALKALEDYYHPAMDAVLNLAVNIIGTTEAENLRVGKITMTLNSNSVSKYLYANTEPQVLEGFAAVNFTATFTSYVGYDFMGFTVDGVDYGPSIEAGELSGIASGSTLVANYLASTGNGISLWDDYADDGSASYRIPALIRTQSGRLIAFSDYRPGHRDVGQGATSIERRYSDDGGETWSSALCIAEGQWGVNKENVIEWSFGDAAVVADNTPGNSGNDVLMVCCGGNMSWPSSVYNPDLSQNQQGCVRWRSADGGETWSNYEYIMPDIMQAFVDAGLRAADGSSGIVRAFFTSGKITQSVCKAEGARYNRIYSAVNIPDQNVVMYSDDFGETWKVLGAQVANQGDEAHIVELPDGDLLLVGRGNSSRWVNVFNYADFNTAAGQWNATGQWNNAVATSCNGDVEVIEAYDAYGEKNTVVVETAPMSSSPQRRDVQYYFIALPKAKGFSVTDFSTVGGASWTQGMNVSPNWSGYSSLLGNGDGTFDILFEECAKGETVKPMGYNIVYQKNHNIKDITLGQYFFSKEQAIAEGIRTPRPGHFYRFKGSASNFYLTPGTTAEGSLSTTNILDATTIWFYSTDGLVSYSTGLFLDGGNKSVAPVGTSYKATIAPSTYYEGKYTLFTNGRYSYDRETNHTIDRGSILNNDIRYAWTVEEVRELPVTVGELGMTAFYSPVDLFAVDGVKVYAATKGETSVRFGQVDAVKGGTGVLVKAEPGTYPFFVEENDAEYVSDLVGNVATVAKSSIGTAVYTLQDGPAFKLYTGENLTGFSSHIEAKTNIEAFGIVIGDNGTGIGENGEFGTDSKEPRTAIYDLSGRQIVNCQLSRGIYIVNGKKIVK